MAAEDNSSLAILKQAEKLLASFCCGKPIIQKLDFSSVIFGAPFSLRYRFGCLSGQLLYKNAFFERTLSAAFAENT